MAQPAITVDGLDELRRALRKVKDKALDDEMKTIHKDLAEEVVQHALPHVPVKSGALKASVRAAGTVRDAVGRAGKKSVPYAPFIHWKIGPPFLRDAAQRIEQDITDRYDTAVAEMLNKVVGR